MASGMSPLFICILSLLAYFLPFLRSPVTQLFAEMPQGSPAMTEDATFARELWGYCFYLFWGGLYGQTMGSGMAAVCA
jgi:hypothetical protein